MNKYDTMGRSEGWYERKVGKNAGVGFIIVSFTLAAIIFLGAII